MVRDKLIILALPRQVATMFAAPRPDDWLVFHGQSSPAEAWLYVRVKHAADAARLVLKGVIRGPHSRYARTLPASVTFQGAARGEELQAQAVLPDPCFWSPALPYLYTAEVQIELDGVTVWTDRRTFGIRRFGVRGRRLYFDAQNWVLRAAHVDARDVLHWDAWREQDMALAIDNPADELCDEADRRGVLIVVIDSGEPARAVERLIAWQRHASVGIVVLDTALTLPEDAKTIAPNTVLAARMTGAAQLVPDWADVALTPTDAVRGGNDTANAARILVRARGGGTPLEFRAACDELQREFAGHGEFAGYLV